MPRRSEDPMQKAARAFRELTADQQSTFLLAVALAGNLQADAPAKRQRAPKAPKEESKP